MNLDKIYTRTGDDGTTGIAHGQRVEKTDPTIEALGDIDELNATIGLLRTLITDTETTTFLLDIQHDLFALGASTAGFPTTLPAERIGQMEQIIDHVAAQLPTQHTFTTPGSNAAEAQAHVCRAVCRRTERHLLRCNPAPTAAQYLNRLSDYFYILARSL